MQIVTFALLAINIAIFIAVNVSNVKPLAYYLVPAYMLEAQGKFIITLFTSLFLHLDSFHIAFNSIALFFLGRIVEPHIGSLRFLIIYIASGIVGGISHSIYSFIEDDIYTPVIGASGAISGIIGLAAAYGDRIALLWLLLQVPFALLSGIENIAFFAHIGGFILGFVVGKVMKIKHYDRYGFYS